MLCDGAARARRDQGRGRRDVEARAAAAGPGGVEQVAAVDPHRESECPHRAGETGELLRSLALGAQRDQEARDLDLARVAVHDLVQHRSGVGFAEVLAPGDAIDRGAENLIGHRSVGEEVREQLAAVVREDRLGMELDALCG